MSRDDSEYFYGQPLTGYYTVAPRRKFKTFNKKGKTLVHIQSKFFLSPYNESFVQYMFCRFFYYYRVCKEWSPPNT